MRRTLLLCAVLLVGCAKSEPPASEPTPAPAPTISLADVAGTWDGNVMAAGSDSVLSIMELTATATTTGWSMKVANAKTPTKLTEVAANSVVAEGDSVVVDSGPFASVLRAGQQVTTHGVYRLQDGKLIGTIMATYAASGQTLMLRSVATRKTQ
jgi:hypothetical protein